MVAKVIIPGRLYHVHGMGIDMDVIASHGCDAITTALSQVVPQ